MYVLDSSSIIEILRDSEKGKKIIQEVKEEDVTSTTICEVEVLIGTKGKTEEYARKLFSEMYIFEFTKSAAKKSIDIAKELKREGKSLVGADIFIAGICKEQDATLVTCDKGFKEIKGLKVLYID